MLLFFLFCFFNINVFFCYDDDDHVTRPLEPIEFSSHSVIHHERIYFIRKYLEQLDKINNDSTSLQSDIQCEYLKKLIENSTIDGFYFFKRDKCRK